MTERNTAFEKIMAGLEDAVAIAKGDASRGVVHHAPLAIDVRAVRRRTGLTQKAFEDRYGFGRGMVRNWEQGTRRPSGAARTLLLVISRTPEVVEEALAEAAA